MALRPFNHLCKKNSKTEEKMAIERISVIGVPVDICTPDKLEDEILELLLKPGTK